MSDRELLQQYLAQRSEAAFRTLFERHLPMVYGAALRRANGDAHLAHDIAQRTFVALFTKARALKDRENLAGWLHTAAGFEAARLVRTESRRRKREEVIEPMDDSKADRDSAEAWKSLSPAIDAAVSELSEKDREPVVLRFFSGKSYAEIGAIIGMTEDSARKRVERALARLREALKRSGIHSTAAALGAALRAHAQTSAAPVTSSALVDGAWRELAKSAAANTGLFAGMNKGVLGLAGFAASVVTTVLVADVRNLQSAQQEAGAIPAQLAASNAEVQAADAKLADARKRAQSLSDAQAKDAAKQAELWAKTQHARIRLENQRFYRTYHLSPATIAAFEAALFERNLTHRKVLAQFSNRAARAPLHAISDAWKAKATEILGPGGWDEYVDYLSRESYYQYVDSLGANLTPGSSALSSYQADQLVALAVAAYPPPAVGMPLVSLTERWTAILEPAANLLEAGQYAVFRAMVDQANTMQELRKVNHNSIYTITR